MSKNILGFESKPIAVVGRELLMLSNQISSRMTQLYKYQLGTKLCNTAATLVTDIYAGLDEMGPTDRKLSLVKKVNSDILDYLPIIRVAKDLNLLSGELFEEVILKVKSLKTQASNWLNYVQEQHKTN